MSILFHMTYTIILFLLTEGKGNPELSCPNLHKK